MAVANTENKPIPLNPLKVLRVKMTSPSKSPSDKAYKAPATFTELGTKAINKLENNNTTIAPISKGMYKLDGKKNHEKPPIKVNNI